MPLGACWSLLILSDQGLVDALRQSAATQERAFAELRAKLLRMMGPKLKGLYSVDDSFVEDVIQETLLVVLTKLDTFRGESAFFTWVCAIAVRLAMAEIRKKRWKDYSLDALTADNAFDPPANSADFTERVAAAETLKVVTLSIMNALTEKQRTALLAELDGMTTDEIARRFGTTAGAVYKLTHDARKALIKDLRKKGFDMEASLGRIA